MFLIEFDPRPSELLPIVTLVLDVQGSYSCHSFIQKTFVENLVLLSSFSTVFRIIFSLAQLSTTRSE